MRFASHTLIAGCILAVFASLAAAQEGATAPDLESEIHAVGNRTDSVLALLERLVAQGDDKLRLRKLQVAILALQLQSTSIGEIESRIRTLEDRRSSANEESVQITAEIERLETLATSDTTPESEREQLTSTKPMLEAQLDLVKRRVWSLEGQILDLQNELAEKRRDADALEDIVMEGLSDL